MPCGFPEEEHLRLTAGKYKGPKIETFSAWTRNKGPEIETSSTWTRNKGSIPRTAGTEASKVSKGDVEKSQNQNKEPS